jgi:hypothetical protein
MGIRMAGINPTAPFGAASVNPNITNKINIANPYLIGTLIDEINIKKKIKNDINNDITFFRINIILF